MKRSIAAGLAAPLVSIGLLASLALSGMAKNKYNPALEDFRQYYQYILDGNADSLRKNERLLRAAKDALARAKNSGDPEKRKVRVAAFKKAVELMEKLVQANKTIAEVFEGKAGPLEFQKAMKEIPKLERQVEALTKKKIKREWLTFEEVKKLREMGWVCKRKASKILPYHLDCWEKPKDR